MKGTWRNWYTRTAQNRIPQGLRVRVSPCPYYQLTNKLCRKFSRVVNAKKDGKTKLTSAPVRSKVFYPEHCVVNSRIGIVIRNSIFPAPAPNFRKYKGVLFPQL